MKVKLVVFRYAFVIVSLVIATRFYSSVFIPDLLFDVSELLLILFLFFFLFLSYNKKIESELFFNSHIKALMFFVLLSALPAYLFHKQGFLVSLLASRTVFLWLFYILLHKWGLDDKVLEKIVLTSGFFWAVIMIGQQITFPLVLFTQRPDDTAASLINIADQRGGLIRIFVQGTGLAYFAIFYYWRKVYENFSSKVLVLFLFTLAALFLSGSRQIVFGVLLIIGIDYLLLFNFKSRKSLQFALLILVGVAIVSPVAIEYISSLVTLSQDQDVTDTDYIRILEMNFFLFEYWPHWLCYFLGNGWEHMSLSAYGAEMTSYVVDRLEFYRSDVGLIGALNKFGLFYILTILFIYFKILIRPKKLYVQRYIKQFFVFLFLTSFTGGDYFERTDTLLLFIITFYIIDKRNEKHLSYNTDL